MLKKLFVSTMLVSLIGGLLLLGTASAERGSGTCSITIDANKHVNGVFSEPTGDCKGHIYGDYTNMGAAISGAVSKTVSNGEVVTFSIPRKGDYSMTVTVIPKKEEPKPDPKPDPDPEPEQPKPNPDPKPEQKPKKPKENTGSDNNNNNNNEDNNSSSNNNNNSNSNNNSNNTSSGNTNNSSENSSPSNTTSDSEEANNDESNEVNDKETSDEADIEKEDEEKDESKEEKENEEELNDSQRELAKKQFLATVVEHTDKDLRDEQEEEENEVMAVAEGNNSGTSGFPLVPIIVIAGATILVIGGTYLYLYKFKGKFRKVVS